EENLAEATMAEYEDHQRWGRELASALDQTYPDLANAVRPRISADCVSLFNNPNAAQLRALYQVANDAMTYLINGNAEQTSILKSTIAGLQEQLAEAQREIATQTSLKDRVTEALLG